MDCVCVCVFVTKSLFEHKMVIIRSDKYRFSNAIDMRNDHEMKFNNLIVFARSERIWNDFSYRLKVKFEFIMQEAMEGWRACNAR